MDSDTKNMKLIEVRPRIIVKADRLLHKRRIRNGMRFLTTKIQRRSACHRKKADKPHRHAAPPRRLGWDDLTIGSYFYSKAEIDKEEMRRRGSSPYKKR